jgi:flagellar hook-associated protein 3 FlgL
MTRVTESQLTRNLLNWSARHRDTINKLNDNISSGITVVNPGDSSLSGTVSLFRQNLDKVAGFKNSITQIKGSLAFQENVMGQMNELLIRAKEIAAQAANETMSPTNRAQLSEEIFQIRDHIVSLGNSTYQGKYVYGGTDDDDAPFDAATYTNPASGDAHTRYVYDTDFGSSGAGAIKTVKLTDDLTITANTPGSQLFNNAIFGLERLGRALAGYATNPATGAPDGTGNAYTFPTDYGTQTTAIKSAMDLIDTSRQSDIMPERVDIAGRLRRITTAESLLDLLKTSSQEALDKLQNTDMYSAATELSQAQTALQASLTVSTRVLQMSILDYI